MGTMSRFRHVVSANVNALLERAEDPEKMLAALVREMEDALREARGAAAELLGEQKRYERRREGLTAQHAQWTERAEQAVARGRDDLAREALAARGKLSEEADRCELAATQAGQGITRVNNDIRRLEKRLAEARSRQQSLRREAQPAKVLSYTSPADRKLADVAARFERLEVQLDQLEARVEAYDIVPQPDRRRAAEADADPAVEEELEALRAKVKGQSEQKGEASK
ncbi:MAG: PspA/IM30 family protein [Pseudomonadota bacterium]